MEADKFKLKPRDKQKQPVRHMSCGSLDQLTGGKSFDDILLETSEDTNGSRRSRKRSELHLFDSLKQSPLVEPQQVSSAPPVIFTGFEPYFHKEFKEGLTPLATGIELVKSEMSRFSDLYVKKFQEMKVYREKLSKITDEIRKHRLYAKEIREANRAMIAVQNGNLESLEQECKRTKANVDVFALFYDFLMQQPAESGYVDLRLFNKIEVKKSVKDGYREAVTKYFEKVPVVKAVDSPPLEADPWSFFLQPSGQIGGMIERFVKGVDECGYDDIDVIADAIFRLQQKQGKFTKDDIINMLFDIAWMYKDYPLTLVDVVMTIPKTQDLCPKVFIPPFLEEEWSIMTFGELAVSDWPLKIVVQELHTLMAITNPFDIADKFYEIIEKIGQCVQRFLIRRNKDAKFVGIDFDQLFVLMLICIFTTGIQDITKPMCYSFNFREYCSSDTKKVYAMSHMEGLCAYLVNVDYADLRKRSAEVQHERILSMEETDPLGIM